MEWSRVKPSGAEWSEVEWNGVKPSGVGLLLRVPGKSYYTCVGNRLTVHQYLSGL